MNLVEPLLGCRRPPRPIRLASCGVAGRGRRSRDDGTKGELALPWGLDFVEGDVVEVWDDPAGHVRVAIELGGPDRADDVVTVLLTPDVLKVVEPA